MATRNGLLGYAAAALLLSLLAALAWLQHRWVSELGDADRQRRQAGLRAAGDRFTREFDRELTRAFAIFHAAPPAPGEEAAVLARLLSRWNEEAPVPELVRGLLLADLAGGTLQRLDPRGPALEPIAWPAELGELRALLSERGPHPGPRPVVLAGETPALAVPFGPRALTPHESSPPGHVPRMVIVLLDGATTTGRLLPRLFEQSFGEGTEWIATVSDALGRAVWSSDPGAGAGAGPVELTLPMYAPRPVDRPELRFEGAGRPGVPPASPQWRLTVAHRDGSLEAAVARARRRNLALGTGVLLLLAASFGLLVEATRRERRLAAQQVTFVAGVSHEMNTPLAAIRSAAQNLADGVVADPQQVKRYGAVIESEGRRLSQLLAEALEMAGIRSGRRLYRRDPVDVASLVDAALAGCAPLLADGPAQVSRDVPPGLRVVGDAEALTRALRNLVDNALKYGGEERWIGLKATGGNGSVTIAVADRGAGVDRLDRPHVFTPFYRGRRAEAGVKGSGLGLAIVKEIVEAHGGRVSVEEAQGGRGSVFAVRLPAAPAEGA